MSEQVIKYLKNNKSINLSEIGYIFYQEYNQVLLNILLDMSNNYSSSEYDENCTKLKIIFEVFSKIIGKCDSNEYESDGFLREYNGLISALNYYYVSKHKFSSDENQSFLLYFQRIETFKDKYLKNKK
jgi:hypothetical protein